LLGIADDSHDADFERSEASVVDCSVQNAYVRWEEKGKGSRELQRNKYLQGMLAT